MNHHTNIVRIKAVANALENLKEKVVFVGGATISLYPDRQVFEVRPTDDVDVIVEILNYFDRAELEGKLRSIGFSHDIESGLACRFIIEGIIVDIMPTNDPSIGFTNRWYSDGFKEAINYKIDDRCSVKILSAPYFIATKLEAHKDRGKGDGRMSQDFEDIIYVLENRKAIWEEMNSTEESLRDYLRNEFQSMLNHPDILEWVDSHVERGSPPATYLILEQIKAFVK